MFEFVNDDDYDCGQAAAATFLAFHGVLPGDQKLLAVVEKEFPPDVLFGWFGTSPARVKEICDRWGVPVREADHREEVYPKIVLMQDGDFGAHWTVLEGPPSDGQVYLTNYGWKVEQNFLNAWDGWIPRFMGFNLKAWVKA